MIGSIYALVHVSSNKAKFVITWGRKIECTCLQLVSVLSFTGGTHEDMTKISAYSMEKGSINCTRSIIFFIRFICLSICLPCLHTPYAIYIPIQYPFKPLAIRDIHNCNKETA